MTIRRIATGEAALYRAVRLAALLESPDAFLSTYEQAAQRSAESWQAQAGEAAEGRDRAIFLAMTDHQEAVGVAALYRDSNDPETGELIQVWVSPPHRGTKLALDLLDAVFIWASCHDFKQIRAEVTTENTRALRFYESYGFVAKPELLGDDIAISKAVG
jgi:ribosomal protein S18 acetylase RimI-like enzyme